VVETCNQERLRADQKIVIAILNLFFFRPSMNTAAGSVAKFERLQLFSMKEQSCQRPVAPGRLMEEINSFFHT
jgi:hypothetical protein